MSVWDDGSPQPALVLGPMDWLRVVLRGIIMVFTASIGLGLLLLIRLFERPIFGSARPVSPFVTQAVCRSFFLLTGITREVHGAPMPEHGAIVANHASWLDILTLNASKRLYFVSKAEVAGWPGVGLLARATGTVFIARKATEAMAQQAVFETRLAAGHKLCFFPEGTSTDGQRLLTFKSTLFAAFFAENMPRDMSIQPVSVAYFGPEGASPRFYGWWGDMEFGSHMLKVLAAPRQGRIVVRFHDPIATADVSGRKEMAALCEAAVRDGLVRAGISGAVPEVP